MFRSTRRMYCFADRDTLQKTDRSMMIVSMLGIAGMGIILASVITL